MMNYLLILKKNYRLKTMNKINKILIKNSKLVNRLNKKILFLLKIKNVKFINQKIV